MSKTPTESVRLIEIDEADAGQRIDNYLARCLKGVPKSRLYRIMRKGEVRINKKRIKPSYKLQLGDEVRIPPIRLAPESAQPQIPGSLLRRLESFVLQEDEDYLIVNKPAGIPVHGGSGHAYGMIEILRAAREHAPFLELAHRLDRDTSGCLVFAKSRAALTGFHTLLREGHLEKRYLALLQGHWEGGTRTVDDALLRTGANVRVDEQGKASLSRFRPLLRLAEVSLVEVSIETGRTHQIRVHAAHIGHPVVGDDKYGDFAFNRLAKKGGLKRLFLHAQSLRFCMPVSGRKYEVQAVLPADLEQVIEYFKS